MVEETVKMIRKIEEKADGIVAKAEQSGADLISKAESDAKTLEDKALSDAMNDAAELKKAAEVRGGKAKDLADEQIEREIRALYEKADSRKERAVSAVIQNLID